MDSSGNGESSPDKINLHGMWENLYYYNNLQSICAGIIATLAISLALNVLIVVIVLLLLIKIIFERVKRTSSSQAPNQALYSEGIFRHTVIFSGWNSIVKLMHRCHLWSSSGSIRSTTAIRFLWSHYRSVSSIQCYLLHKLILCNRNLCICNNIIGFLVQYTDSLLLLALWKFVKEVYVPNVQYQQSC